MDHHHDLSVRSASVDDTASLAKAIADQVVAGDVLVLGGELGAGKTAFTQAFGAQLGVTEQITSPTFALAQRYDGGRLVVHHLDVYRIEEAEEVTDLALPELFESGGVVVIEWGDTIAPALPSSYLLLQIGFGPGDDDRVIELFAIGISWQPRLLALRRTLDLAEKQC